MDFLTDTARWLALCARNPAAHTAFIYAVTTTRIFCRPTCSSRLARRAHVVFFDTAADASRAGFRACKRCKPAALLPTLEERQLDTIRRACRIMRGSAGPVALEDVARQVGWSSRYFHGIFKREMGITPVQYAKQCEQQAENASLGTSTPSDASSAVASIAAGPTHANMPSELADLAASLPLGGYAGWSTPQDLPENMPFTVQDTAEAAKASLVPEDYATLLDPALCGDILSLEGILDCSLHADVYSGEVWLPGLAERGQVSAMELGETFDIEPWELLQP